MSIHFRAYKYNADFSLCRNNFKFRRCSESNKIIWPFENIYCGMEKLRWTGGNDVYRLKKDQYLILKIKNEVS